MEYARKMGNGFDRVTAAMNFDGVGPFTGTTTVATYVASLEFDALVDEKLGAYPGVMRQEPWPASDHYIFYSNGTPSIAFTSKGIRDVFHTRSDTFEWISGAKLAEAARLGLELIEVLDEKDPAWSRPDR
jgi:Zn-dependent M28 family amino/carboxypeptidase